MKWLSALMRRATTAPGHPPTSPHPARHAFTPARPTVYVLTGNSSAHAREIRRYRLEKWTAKALGTDLDGLLDYAADQEDH